MVQSSPEVSFEGAAGSGASDGRVRTVFVFLDLPRHVEYRMGELPILSKGTVVEFDVSLRSPSDVKRVRKVSGPYSVVRQVLKYSTSRVGLMGLTQYLEWGPC